MLTYRPEPPPLLLSPIHAPKLVFPPTTSPSMMEGKVSPPPPSSPPTIQLPTSGASSSMPVIIPPGAGQLLNTYQAYISMLGQPPPPQNRAFTPLKDKGKQFPRNLMQIWNNQMSRFLDGVKMFVIFLYRWRLVVTERSSVLIYCVLLCWYTFCDIAMWDLFHLSSPTFQDLPSQRAATTKTKELPE